MERRTLLGGSIAVLGLSACARDARAQAALDPENTLILELPAGRVTIQLLPDLAPRHVERVKLLVRRGFYDNTPFHRVIEGFMAQGGDPTGTGRGGSDLPDLPAEFSPPSRARFIRGTVGAARSQNPNSANSQFFIMFAPNAGLDGQYTIWGRVVAGMDAVDRIKRGSGQMGMVPAPADRIRTARIAADIR
ncbi:peptidylprolyl isomerase [Roseomonas eburnea]|uniref:Peptidyl-prolyl cis-trans isomerase n=1 Tax=Neoroseomonas eburnea TaxID=1346889 RepID=A0A9X9XDA2_9PROT|nr:peptidylprolyl isomerase [Neoroseomonas eburnea]MBR0681688.1 peptidylprolyl isomerase [Neoroseomonas eburnea]